jgi:cyclopropane fatty-acyl-phospholipid synthase-like methyltransferase
LGSKPQNFLGARWIRTILARASAKKKRLWALRMLSLSPHYFVDPENPKYAGMSSDEYLEAVFESYVESRKEIFDTLLAANLSAGDTVIDFGCGPGFLSKLIAERVSKVYGCDISEGALACAEILNHAPNLVFVHADEQGMASIENGSVDTIFSYAVVQHLSDEVLQSVLDTCNSKLKPGGRIMLHVQLDDPGWKTEKEWRDDNSIQGKLKLKYGLNCFARSREAMTAIIEAAGFHSIEIDALENFIHDDPKDLSSQAILTAIK